MGIKHALLALLENEPTHGYELQSRFDAQMGALWPLKRQQVYNNLRLLEKGGLIALDGYIEQDDLPDRKNYRLTEAGAAELVQWLDAPVRGNRQLKDEFYLKLVTLLKVLQQPRRVNDLLWQQRDVYLQHLRELERALADAEASGDEVIASLLEGAILHAEADVAWLERVEDRLNDGKLGSNATNDGSREGSA